MSGHRAAATHAHHLPLLGAHVSTAGGWSQVPPRATAIGAEVVQTFSSNPRIWPTSPPHHEALAQLAVDLSRLDLPLFIHSIYLINPASPDDGLRERTAGALAHALVSAAIAGAAGVVTHLGSHRGAGFDRALSWIVDTLRTARTRAERDIGALETLVGRRDAPLDPPPLLLETGAGSGATVGGSLVELETLLASLDLSGRNSGSGFGLCLDTAHMYAAGYPLHYEDGLAEVIAELQGRDLFRRVFLIHLNDSASDFASRRDRHANPGEGQFGREGMSRLIRCPALAHIPFVMEVPGSDGRGPGQPELATVKTMRSGAPPQRPLPGRPGRGPREQG